jgi:molecular chaperone GrpE (heat shock protein)
MKDIEKKLHELENQNKQLTDELNASKATIDSLNKKIDENNEAMKILENSCDIYTKKIVDGDIDRQKSQDILRALSKLAEDQKDQISKLESDLKFTKEKSTEQFLQKLFDLINTIKIFKNKIDKEFLKYVTMIEKQISKHLPVYGIEMKEFFIGDNYNEFDDANKEICEVTDIEDSELPNGYIKDIISNAFIKGENVMSFAKIFVVNNDA